MQAERRHRPFWLRAVGAAAYLALMSVVGVTGAALGWLNSSDVMGEALRQQALNVPPEEVFARGGVQSDSLVLLLLGCDEDRYYGGPRSNRRAGQVLETAARSDMIMVARLDFAYNRITGVTIPRDLEVGLDGYRKQKINAYHAIGGREGGAARAKELAKEAVESVIGTRIDRVIVLDFQVFQEIVDMLGGVEVYVPKDMHYVDKAGGLYIDLKKGHQRLDGYQAMGFVRYRHDDSDFLRQERQRDIMVALRARMLEKWQMSPKLVDKSIELLGNEFDAREVAALALFSQRVGPESINIQMIPVLAMRGTTNLALDTKRLPKTLEEARLGSSRPR